MERMYGPNVGKESKLSNEFYDTGSRAAARIQDAPRPTHLFSFNWGCLIHLPLWQGCTLVLLAFERPVSDQWWHKS